MKQSNSSIEKYYPVILSGITILLYLQTLMFGFVLDDEAVISKNKFVQQGISGIPDILTSFYWQGYWNLNGGLYRPLSLISFAIEWEISPANPFLHHFINIALYTLCITMLYKLLLKIIPGNSSLLAASIALLYAVHPLHTEVVANIKSRDEILCLMFLLLSANALLKSEKPSLTVAIFYILALSSKESAIMFLPVYFFMQHMLLRRNIATSAKVLAPAILAAIVWMAWRYYVLSTAPPRVPYTLADNSLFACDSIFTQKLTALTMLGSYILKLVYPLNLSYDYSYNQVPCAGLGDITTWLAIMIVAGLITIFVRTYKNKPVISFGILFFFLTLLPASNILFPVGTTMADRLMFTPMLGLILAGIYFIFDKAGLLNEKTLSTKVAAPVAIITVVLFTISFNRSKAWESNYSLFTTDINNAPNSARTNYNSATIFLNSGADTADYKLALEYFEKANKIDPTDYNTLLNMGVAYYRNHEYPSAVGSFIKAIATGKDNGNASLNLADVYFTTQKWDSAAKYYERAIQLKAINNQTHNKAGTAYFNLQQYDKAARIFSEGIKTYPDNTELLINYGNGLAMQKNYDSALAMFQKVYTLDKNQVKALYFIALTYQSMNNRQLADSFFNMYKKYSAGQ